MIDIFILELVFLYQMALLYIVLAMQRQRPCFDLSMMEGRHNFAIIIAAHNEEKVIGATLENLEGSYYLNTFDIYVICDHCDDQTVLIVQRYTRDYKNIILMDRQEGSRGKQHAIKWALWAIDINKYDALVLMDADTQADPCMLCAFDRRLAAGDRVIQAYLATANPVESWISANYSYIYYYMNRLQMARQLVGLTAWAGGTGCCIHTDIIRRLGWNMRTVTDDLELTCQLILAGERVAFDASAVVYDQKPINLRDSIRQRIRWIRGQTQCTFIYLPRIMIYAVQRWWNGDLKGLAQAVDSLFWIPMHLIILASMVASFVYNPIGYVLCLILAAPAFNALPMAAERVCHWKAWALLCTVGAFYVTWLPVVFWGVITCGQKSWARTPHHAYNSVGA